MHQYSMASNLFYAQVFYISSNGITPLRQISDIKWNRTCAA